MFVRLHGTKKDALIRVRLYKRLSILTYYVEVRTALINFVLIPIKTVRIVSNIGFGVNI